MQADGMEFLLFMPAMDSGHWLTRKFKSRVYRNYLFFSRDDDY